eukprot:CAMPEP_0176344220 /NCGR_PEP_ID=MMETSP0126-20121128/4535_1 /TAXON_ID=141414 ORGANISM="Strombidinopsis acuminatum, Strain SPMC142" /NCGR_SAMPLE_ID=MMETSP0126 /ASSEMBLY_ACC=CAM_ASM_000229 /LENGTH=84 /DNA_ID=CAMNT_0017690569 /DNA_START=295 /DNA_END=549 /DNA_ORIENTATION=+
MKDQIVNLEKELVQAKRQSRAYAIYRAIDPESTNSVSYKTFISKLSGFAKFDLDTKIDIHQFYKLVEEMGSVQVETEEHKDEEE